LLLVSSRDHAYVDHVQLSWEGEKKMKNVVWVV